MAYLTLVISTGVGLIFVASGLAKMQAGHFRAVVERYRLLPAPLVTMVAFVLPPFESALGLLLIIGLVQTGAMYVGASLLAIFSVAIFVNLMRNNKVDCGCRARAQQISWSLLCGDLLLLMGSVVAAQTPSSGILLTAFGHGALRPSAVLAVAATFLPLWLAYRTLDAAGQAQKRMRSIYVLMSEQS